MNQTPSPSSSPTRKGSATPEIQVIGDMNTIGLQVRAQRLKQSLRIDDAAALIGVSVDLLSRLENGHGGVRSDKLLAVLNSLGLAMVLLPKDHPKMHTLEEDRTVRQEAPK